LKNKPTSIKELCAFIWYLEGKYNLLDLEIDGVKPWQSQRMSIYYTLALELKILNQAQASMSIKDKFSSLFSYFINSVKYNPFNIFKAEVVIVSGKRVSKINDREIDIYSKYFLDELIKTRSVIEFEQPYLGKHYKQIKKYTYYSDWIDLSSKIYIFLNRANITKSQINFLKVVENEIETLLDIKFNLSNYLIKSIVRFKIEYKLYRYFLKRTEAKNIYIVNAYMMSSFIKAAKDSSIEVYELQHGIFSEYHLGYSYPQRIETLEYFPHKFLVWNEFWKTMIKLPIENKDIIIDRFRYLEKEKKKYIHLEKKQNQMLILSQGAIGEKIAKKILDNFDFFEQYEIIYKLHPGEYERWKSYSSLVELNRLSNITVVKDELLLYELFATSQYQVGVFSTAIYEGVEFGCKTILLDLTGIEYMDKFIKFYNPKII